jgi:5-methylthioadenosine/S-adenosylhomocysteine deaminase
MSILFQNARVPGFAPDKRIFVAVDGNTITSVSETKREGKYDREIDVNGNLLTSGLYNAHTHAAMTLFRGYGEDLPLDRWLHEKIFPAEDRLTYESVYNASLLAAAEMTANGIVSFTDMYMFCDATVKAALEAGMKANISRAVLSFDENSDMSKDERVIESVALFNAYNGSGDGRIKIDMSLHAEYTNTENSCRYMANLANKLGARMHVHLSETKSEHIEGKERRNGRSPARFFADCGVFDIPTTAAHCVWVDDSDVMLMAEKKVTAVHNPRSNLKLASGIMRYKYMRDNGVNITFGTDGAASNNRLDVMGEATLAAMLHKGAQLNAIETKAADILTHATKCGAISQGRNDCGEIAVGNRADIILIKLNDTHNMPLYDLYSTFAYSAASSDVYLTMADGEILYENGEYKKLDIEKIKRDFQKTVDNYF